VSEILNGTSAHKRPFSALNVLSKSNYVEKMKKKINKISLRSRLNGRMVESKQNNIGLIKVKNMQT